VYGVRCADPRVAPPESQILYPNIDYDVVAPFALNAGQILASGINRLVPDYLNIVNIHNRAPVSLHSHLFFSRTALEIKRLTS
jgi:hypothetical protein